jgi:Na+:H+ antiporter, NhaA family
MSSRKNALRSFLDNESSSGILILLASALGLVVANSPVSSSYFDAMALHLDFGNGALSLSLTVQKVINYVLMTIFFFVVGLEIKRELTAGHLASVKKALLPFIAALGGMAIPAFIYLAFAGRTEAGGWGVPVATDIALAVGLLAMVGTGAPQSLRSFLLALAVIDDIGAILIIAFVYSTGVAYSWLLASALVIGWILIMKRVGVVSTSVYVFVGIFLWFTLYKTGVHPTLAGVILGLLTPNTPRDEKSSVIEWLEAKLHPLSSFIIVPIFAFANTGVRISSETIDAALTSVVAWGIFFGLVVGKPLGILATSIGAAKLKLVDMPSGASKGLLGATGSAAGIGFTVSIFIAHLAFKDSQLQDIAVLSVIAASIVSAGFSGTLFRIYRR